MIVQTARLSLAIEHEMSGVRRGFAHGPIGHVRRLFVKRDFAGDPVVFEPHIAPDAVVVQVWFDVVVILRVITQVAIELTVIRIAGITYNGTPDLFTGFGVAREYGHAFRGDDRRVNSAPRARLAVKDRMGVGDEKIYPCRAQVAVVAGSERAFGQPGAARGPPEMLDVILLRDLNLRAFDRLVRHQRQEAVRRVAGDDLKEAVVLQLTEPLHDVATILVFKNLAAFIEMAAIHQRG